MGYLFDVVDINGQKGNFKNQGNRKLYRVGVKLKINLMLISILLQSYASINEQAVKSANEIYQHALIRNLLICGAVLFVLFILPELFKNKEDEK